MDVLVVPHTHWDREWYEPFQRFRMRLVELLDALVTRMEADPTLRFTLDGQFAAVDDYLEVRPEQRARLAALVASGRLAVGPWQILLDEFLCAGETIVRNLELGWSRATALGGAMPVGYLPDMFGHCAQMPQLLARAGLAHACVWRGVPAGVDRHAFRWEAPDGTALRTEYLPEGYGNAAYLFGDPDRLTERAADFAAAMAPWFGDDPVLAMYGTDHAFPVAELTGQVDRLAAAGGLRPALGTLADYLAGRDPDEPGLPVVRGELRSHARANILPGVISARVHLKAAMARAERLVTRYAEPWAALWGPGWTVDWPQRFLDLAWWRLVDASGHDSVTGCGVDETAVQVAARIAEAGQLGQAVRDRAVAALAAAVPADGWVAVNPTAADRVGWTEAEVGLAEDAPGVSLALPDGRRVAAQTLAVPPRLLAEERLPAGDLPRVLRRIHGEELFGRCLTGWAVEPGRLTLHVGRVPHPGVDPAALGRAVADGARHHPGSWTVRILAEPARRVVAAVPVPALGWTALHAVPEDTAVGAPVRRDGATLDNGLLQVEVEEAGTLALRTPDGWAAYGLGRVVDGGDRGDTYNYGPPADDRLVEHPEQVTVHPACDGPLVAALEVVRRYGWPVEVDLAGDRRSAATEPTEVRTRVELRAGEPFVRLTVSFDNRCADHRVRWHLPLPAPADTSYAEGQFAVVARGRQAEGGGGERPEPTYPADAFVAAGGLAVLLDHVTEYELVDPGRELALTLLRAVGYLSRNVHPYRDEPAGPELPTPAAQCPGRREVRLALLPYRGRRPGPEVAAAAEAFRHDLHAAPGTAPAGGPLPAGGPGLEVTGGQVTLASLRRRAADPGWLELRLVAGAAPTEARVRWPPPAGSGGPGPGEAGSALVARRVDLLGRPGAALPTTAAGLRLPLRAWEVATVQVRRTNPGQRPVEAPAVEAPGQAHSATTELSGASSR